MWQRHDKQYDNRYNLFSLSVDVSSVSLFKLVLTSGNLEERVLKILWTII